MSGYGPEVNDGQHDAIAAIGQKISELEGALLHLRGELVDVHRIAGRLRAQVQLERQAADAHRRVAEVADENVETWKGIALHLAVELQRGLDGMPTLAAPEWLTEFTAGLLADHDEQA